MRVGEGQLIGAGNVISNAVQSPAGGSHDASQAYSRGKPVQTLGIAPRNLLQAGSLVQGLKFINTESLSPTSVGMATLQPIPGVINKGRGAARGG